MVNVVAGLLLVAMSAVFWLARDYTTRFGGILPDPVLLLLAVLGVVLAVLGLTTRRAEGLSERVPLLGLLRAVGVLVGWVAILPVLGYLLGGFVFFLGCALLVRDRRPRLRDVALDVVVAAITVGGFYLLFTRLLVVPLPPAGGL